MKSTLNDLKKVEENSYDKTLSMLANDKQFQEAYNRQRLTKNLPEIDFAGIQSLE